MRNNPDYFFKKYTCHDILDWVLFLNGVQPGIADFRRVISSTVTSYDQVDVPFAFTKRLVQTRLHLDTVAFAYMYLYCLLVVFSSTGFNISASRLNVTNFRRPRLIWSSFLFCPFLVLILRIRRTNIFSNGENEKLVEIKTTCGRQVKFDLTTYRRVNLTNLTDNDLVGSNRDWTIHLKHVSLIWNYHLSFVLSKYSKLFYLKDILQFQT